MLIVSCIVKGVLCLAMEFFEIAYVETFGITCYGKKIKDCHNCFGKRSTFNRSCKVVAPVSSPPLH